MPLDPRELARIAAAKKQEEAEKRTTGAVEEKQNCFLKAEEKLPALLATLDRCVEACARTGRTEVVFYLSSVGTNLFTEDVLADFFWACRHHPEVVAHSAKQIGSHFESMGFNVQRQITFMLNGLSDSWIRVRWG